MFSQTFANILKKIRSLVLFSALLFSSYTYAYAVADLTILPATGTFVQGETFTVSVSVANNNQAINAISGAITFPTNLLTVKSVTKDGSIIKLWAEEPSFSNTNGTIKFEGVVLNPGFASGKGKILNITFTAKKAGDASVIFASGQVLANDGEATNVLQSLLNANFTITQKDTPTPALDTTPVEVAAVSATAPKITSSSYPDTEAWYNSRDASFAWEVPKGITAVRTLYGLNEKSIPTKVYDPPINNRSFKTDIDGVQYMHVQFKGGDGWGEIATYKFQIDTKSPESLHVTFPDGVLTVNPKPTISVLAEDALSGMGSVVVQIDGGASTTYPVSENNLYTLPEASSGKHTVLVYAVDKAGNKASVSLDYTIIEISAPTILEYTKKAKVGEVLKVIGSTYPASTVEVALTDQEGGTFKETTTSNQDGGFVLLYPKKLTADVYEMKARVIDSRGAASKYSPSKVMVIERQTYIEVGMFVMNWLSLLLVIIIGVLCVLLTLWFSFIQFNRFRKKVRRTMKEAENTLKANVLALRRDTEEFHTILLKAEKKRPLTKEEQSILKKFKKRLEITEKEIESKLEQIG